MSWFEKEDQKEEINLLSVQFIKKHTSGFWKPYITGIACLSRANMEVLLSLMRQQPHESLGRIAEQLQARGENPTDWYILIIIKEAPADVPKDNELPQELTSEDGNIKIRIHVEVIPGLEMYP